MFNIFKPVTLLFVIAGLSLSGLSGIANAANLKPVDGDLDAPDLVLKDLQGKQHDLKAVSYTHLRAHQTPEVIS